MMQRMLCAQSSTESVLPVPCTCFLPSSHPPWEWHFQGLYPGREPGDPIILLQDCCEIMATFVLLWGLGFLIYKMEWGRRTAWFSWVSTLAIPGAYAALGSTFQLYGFQGEFVSN